MTAGITTYASAPATGTPLPDMADRQHEQPAMALILFTRTGRHRSSSGSTPSIISSSMKLTDRDRLSCSRGMNVKKYGIVTTHVGNAARTLSFHSA